MPMESLSNRPFYQDARTLTLESVSMLAHTTHTLLLRLSWTRSLSNTMVMPKELATSVIWTIPSFDAHLSLLKMPQ